MDRISAERRSKNMARIRSRDTGPELIVRRFLHSHGLRFRVRGYQLLGKPDVVFPRLRLCVFVHGCFWHGCPTCVDGTRAVKSNSAYWTAKISGNQARDRRVQADLSALGWRVLTIWECETANPAKLAHLEEMIRRARSEVSDQSQKRKEQQPVRARDANSGS